MSLAKSSKQTGARRDNDQFIELVREFPLRPIRTKREYAAATKVMERLAMRGEDDLNRDELDYLDVLTGLVETYDKARYSEPDERTPLERLTALLEESGTSTAELGRLLGNSGLASQVVLGRRELSKAHIRILSRHFKLDAGYFL